MIIIVLLLILMVYCFGHNAGYKYLLDIYMGKIKVKLSKNPFLKKRIKMRTPRKILESLFDKADIMQPELSRERERFINIMSEHTPTIAEDSQHPEWTRGELDKAYDDLVARGVVKQRLFINRAEGTSAGNSVNPI